MIVDSNAPAPLKYTDPTFQALLFIRANIYDTSGVSPTLESTVNLALINNGVYWGKYTFTPAKTYLVQKLVYTDGTYSTVDQSYAQDNDDIQCIDLKTANMDATVSSRNSTAHFDAIIGTPANASIAADIAEIEGETDAIITAVAAIPTTPVLTSHFDTVIGVPAGASIAADLAEIESETDGIAAIPTNPLLTNDARLNHLDADVSTRLATSGYTAPDNADIVLIKAKTDNLPASPANEVTSAAIKAKTDNLPADPASNTQVNTRLPTSSYVAPDNADIVAIKAKTDNLPVDPTSTATILTALASIDTDVLSRVSTGHFDGVIGVPAGASIAADLAEIEGETDAIAGLETDAAAATREAAILAAVGGASVAVVYVEDTEAQVDESYETITAEIDESDDL